MAIWIRSASRAHRPSLPVYARKKASTDLAADIPAHRRRTIQRLRLRLVRQIQSVAPPNGCASAGRQKSEATTSAAGNNVHEPTSNASAGWQQRLVLGCTELPSIKTAPSWGCSRPGRNRASPPVRSGSKLVASLQKAASLAGTLQSFGPFLLRWWPIIQRRTKAQQQTHHVTKGDHPVWCASGAERALRICMVHAAFFLLVVIWRPRQKTIENSEGRTPSKIIKAACMAIALQNCSSELRRPSLSANGLQTMLANIAPYNVVNSRDGHTCPHTLKRSWGLEDSWKSS